MAYSTIQRKKCKGCGLKYPVLGLNGYCSKACMPEEMAALPKYNKKPLSIRRRNFENKLSRDIKVAADENNALVKSVGGSKLILDNWFKERRNEMQSFCTECGRRININDDKFYRWSICHIVPKSLVPSVATHENNWIELCQLHHQEFDNTFDKAAKMMCFGEVKQKFQLFKHLIPAEELRKVNPHLLT